MAASGWEKEAEEARPGLVTQETVSLALVDRAEGGTGVEQVLGLPLQMGAPLEDSKMLEQIHRLFYKHYSLLEIKNILEDCGYFRLLFLC